VGVSQAKGMSMMGRGKCSDVMRLQGYPGVVAREGPRRTLQGPRHPEKACVEQELGVWVMGPKQGGQSPSLEGHSARSAGGEKKP
jgi:hypothetical protein